MIEQAAGTSTPSIAVPAPGAPTAPSTPVTTAPAPAPTVAAPTVPPPADTSTTVSGSAPATPPPASDPARPPTDVVARVVGRVTFGATPELLAEVAATGLDAWLESQLDPASIDDPVDARLVAANPFLSAANRENRERDSWPLRRDAQHVRVARAVGSRRQIFEMVVEMWTDHFSIHFDDDWFATKVGDDRDVVRTHALGRFADLLLASAHSPAMLAYLDNASSDANSTRGVNENYARELLELHTLGIVDGAPAYTEQDVRAVALVLSGWTIDDDWEFRYDPERHHEGPVQVLGGAWTTPGRGGQDGYQDGVDLLGFLARRPQTARHVATRIARRFVADSPPTELVDRLAAAYLDADTDIAAVLRALFASAELREAASPKLRRPLELLGAQLRRYGAELAPTGEAKGSRTVRWMLERMGQLPFAWPAPNGYPDVAGYWTSADGVLQRWATAAQVARGWIDGVDTSPARLWPAGPPATWADLVERIELALLDRPFAEADRATILSWAGHQPTDAFDADAEWATRGVLALACTVPSFQFR